MNHALTRLLSTVCLAAWMGGTPFPAIAEDTTTPTTPAAAPAEPKAEAKAPIDYVILDVEGEKVHYSDVVKIWEGLFPEGQAPDFGRFDDKVRQNVLRGIVSERLIYKQAAASGVESSAKVQETLKRMKDKLVTQAFLEQKAGEKITDAAVRAEYDKKSTEMKGKQQLRASHILVQTEDEAKEVLEKLEDDGDFAALAKEKSQDHASAARGGDLGWFGEKEMIPEFTKAAYALKEDEFSKPVKTQFGWHIIRVDEKRDAKMPPYEEMVDAIRQELKEVALKKYIGDLVDTSHVKYYDAAGKELELTMTPDNTSAPIEKTE